MNIHFVMHEEFEAPGAFLTWVNQRNYSYSISKLYKHEKLPLSKDVSDMLVVMGGPQSPDTTNCSYFDAQKEMDLIKKYIDANKFVLGVCLGAQLIGEALGATFAHSPNKEIGVFPITLTQDGKKTPWLQNFPQTISVGHWHGDMPGLSADAKILATSNGCPRQIIQYSPKVCALQCHLELTSELVKMLIKNSPNDFENAQLQLYIQTPEQIIAYDYSEMNQLLFSLLDAMLANS